MGYINIQTFTPKFICIQFVAIMIRYSVLYWYSITSLWIKLSLQMENLIYTKTQDREHKVVITINMVPGILKQIKHHDLCTLRNVHIKSHFDTRPKDKNMGHTTLVVLLALLYRYPTISVNLLQLIWRSHFIYCHLIYLGELQWLELNDRVAV